VYVYPAAGLFGSAIIRDLSKLVAAQSHSDIIITCASPNVVTVAEPIGSAVILTA
jgi:hypothetical protein